MIYSLGSNCPFANKKLEEDSQPPKKKKKMKTKVHEYEGSFNQCSYAYHAKTRSTPQKHFFAYLMDDVPKHSEQNIYRSIGVGRPS